MRYEQSLEKVLDWPSLQAKIEGPPGPHPPYTITKTGGKYYVKNSLGQTKNGTGFATEAEAVKLQQALYAALPPGFKVPAHKKHPNP